MPFPVPPANGAVPILDFRAELLIADDTNVGHGQLIYTLVPHPRLDFTITLETNQSRLIDLQRVQPSLKVLANGGFDVPVYIRSVRCSSSGPVEVQGTLRKGLLWPKRKRATRILFHIVNLDHFVASSDVVLTRANGGGSRLGCLNLISAEWKLDIAQFATSKPQMEEAKATEGFAVTHIGALSRVDGNTISVGEALAGLELVHHFLALLQGRWCGPGMVVADDGHGACAWWLWPSMVVDPWRRVRTWLPVRHAEEVMPLFDAFSVCWGRNDWKDALSNAIYWYVLANVLPNVDAQVILVHTALELLAWNYLTVNDMSTKGNTVERIRRCLNGLDLGVAIPNELSHLKAQCADCGDICDILVYARNAIVHPDNRNRGRFDDVLPLVAQLGLWLLELTLLRLLGYRGLYANRLPERWVGDEDLVPWATQE